MWLRLSDLTLSDLYDCLLCAISYEAYNRRVEARMARAALAAEKGGAR